MLPAEELERVACLLLALGGQLVEQELFERLWGEMALEHAGDRHRDRARLLGDDDDDGIGDLADADARAMACSNAYCNNAQVVILPADKAADYGTVDSLSGLRFAVESGSAGMAQAEEKGLTYTDVVDQATALLEDFILVIPILTLFLKRPKQHL